MMIVVMNHHAGEAAIASILKKIAAAGLQAHLPPGLERTIICVAGDQTRLQGYAFEALPGVEKVIPIQAPYKLAGREYQSESTIVKVGGQEIGGRAVVVMAGPCAVESREQLLQTAQLVRQSGATMLRGGAYKPRTSPYSFQGLEEEGLVLLAEARELTGLLVVTEVLDLHAIECVARYSDIIQIGARNMQNFFLLREAARVGKPVLLKRSSAATIEEWLLAAEYILAEGNGDVILCERGVRTFEHYTRNTLDLTAVPVVKHLSHLPVIVDPCHAIGKWRFVEPMSRAALAAGADGLMIEVHPHPARALCDGFQSLNPENFRSLMRSVGDIAAVMGRKLARPVR